VGTIRFDKEVVSEGSALCSKARKGRQEIRKGDIRQETGIRGNERGSTKEMWSQIQTFGIKRERKREEIKNREEEHCTRG